MDTIRFDLDSGLVRSYAMQLEIDIPVLGQLRQ
jgi:hypothetical protein